MKKKLLMLLLIAVTAVCLVLGISACSNGGDEPEPVIGTEGLEYELSDDGTYYIVTSIGSAEGNDITVSSEYNGKPVKEIGYQAFNSCHSLTSVIIPNSVTYIDDWAFGWCISLESITIPNSVTSIGVNAFFGCDSLEFNEYDNAKYLGNDQNPYVALIEAKNSNITSCNINENTKVMADEAFYRCSSLESITIPNGVTSIGNWAFASCASLESMAIPNSVTTIGWFAFRNCRSLTSIIIPNSVTYIGAYAFDDCNSLTSITIPNSVISIGDRAFRNCSSLETVYYTGSEAQWNSIDIGEDNTDLTEANIVFNYEG